MTCGVTQRAAPKKRPKMASRLALAVLVAVIATPTLACPTGVTIIDGDTIAIDGEHVRLTGFDTPEVAHARCDAERELGQRATQRLEELVCRSGEASVEVVMSTRRLGPATERHGRALARIVVDGLDVGEILVAEGLARRSKPRRGWCHIIGGRQLP